MSIADTNSNIHNQDAKPYMDHNYDRLQAREHFQRLRHKGLLSGLISIIRPKEHNQLLSFYDVRELLGAAKQETYLGLYAVPIDKIIGSEGRYQDFTRTFLPKFKHLQERWVSISTATQKDVILPPIQLFKVGDAYFIRDGNHRVSVARASGIEMIDAEVVEIASDVYLSPDMTHKEILQRVIEYERKLVYKHTRLANFIDTSQLILTSAGAYTVIVQHILGHKHFMEQERRERKATEATDGYESFIELNHPVLSRLDDTIVSFGEAAQSWYEHLFAPIIELIHRERLLSLFPERSAADLYIWLISHWQYLKDIYGDDVPLADAVSSYRRSLPTSLWQKLGSLFKQQR